MEGILQSIVAASFRQMEGKGLSLYRYDSLSESFPDVWALQDGQIVRRYSSRAARGSLTGRILYDGKLFSVADVAAADGMSPFLPAGIRSFVAVPVLVHGTPWGVLYVNSHQPHAFAADDEVYVQALARQLGKFAEESAAGSSGSVELSTVRVLAATVDAKDHYTRHHSTNVSFYARLLAQRMNLGPDEIRRIDLAGLLHDIGKIAVPDQVLQKPAALTPQERLLIQTHAAIGGNILAQAPYLGHLVALVRHHHEWYNGKGYPDGLAGDDIPLGAAILALADAFDTMTSERVYRPAMQLDEAMAEVQRCSGVQFHPTVVEAWQAIVAEATQREEAWLLALTGAKNPSWQLAATGSFRDLADEPIGGVRRQDPLDFLTDIRLIHRLKELNVILSRAGNAALNFWAAHAVQIYLWSPENQGVTLGYNAGSPKGHRMVSRCEQALPSAVSHGLISWVLQTRQGANLPDARRDPRWSYGDAFDETVSVLVTPIESGTETVGVIQVVSPGESSFGRQDVKAIRIFAALLGEAIGNVRQESGGKLSAQAGA